MIAWRPVPDFPGYSVSSDGRVLSSLRKRPRILKPETDKDGYRRVVLCRNGEHKHFIISRLVLTCFVGPPTKETPQALHWDGDVSNNSLENLYWGNALLNASDRDRHGRTSQGEPHHLSKLNVVDVKKIHSMVESGASDAVIAEQFDVCAATIWFIRTGRTWKSVDFFNVDR